MFRTLNGYKNKYTDQGDSGIGKQCGGSPIYSSLKWELVNSDEEKVKATSFDDPYYHKYQRRAAFKCNEDQNCGNITVTKEGKYETFHPSQCINTIANSDAVTWKRWITQSSKRSSQLLRGLTPRNKRIYRDHYRGEPQQKFSWRVNERETDIRCDSSQRVKYGKDMKKQGRKSSWFSRISKVCRKCYIKMKWNMIVILFLWKRMVIVKCLKRAPILVNMGFGIIKHIKGILSL